MKILFLLFVAFVGTFAQTSDECLEISCLPRGEICGQVNVTQNMTGLVLTCGVDSFCLTTEGGFGVCVPASPLGERCPINIPDSCMQLPFQTVICTDGRPWGLNLSEPQCNLGEGQARINEPCIADIQCSGLASCIDGKCMGLGIGSNCNITEDCDFGHFCSINRTCMPQVGEGETCFGMGLSHRLDRESCQIGLTCGISGTCMRMFAGMEGDLCISTDECSIGTFCLISNFTESLTNFANAANFSGVCTPFPNGTINCVNTDDCRALGVPPFVSCECDGFELQKTCQLTGPTTFPIFYPPFSSQLFEDIVMCYKNNNCSLFSTGPNSCGEINCARETSCFMAALEVFGPLNQRIISNQCRADFNFTCEGLTGFTTGTAINGTVATATAVTGTAATETFATGTAATTGSAPATTGSGILGNQCLNQGCCTLLSNPNIETGLGYLEFDPACLHGGVNCLDVSGCRFCFNSNSRGTNLDNLLPCRNIIA